MTHKNHLSFLSVWKDSCSVMDQPIVPSIPGFSHPIATTSISQYNTANSNGNFEENLNYYLDDMSSDDVEELSPIELSIKVPMAVTGDENRVTADPSVSANKIAIGIMHALKTVSINGIGMPMIDENGRPRPIKIDVMAEIKIDGSRNIVGEAATLKPVSSQPTNELQIVKVAHNEVKNFEVEHSKNSPVINEAHDDGYLKRNADKHYTQNSDLKRSRCI